jgi:glycosyltransferase involved in cell wall biosynthesis
MGLRRPVHIIPFGFDPAFFHPRIRGARRSDRFTFLAFTDGTPRGGYDLLLRAYAKAFTSSENVLLLVNRLPVGGVPAFEKQTAELASRAAAPVTVLDRETILRHEMPAFYRGADCFVLPTRWNGFGMSALEAMACGLPVIANERGGHRDFVSGDNAFIARLGAGPDDGPDVDHLAELMRRVVKSRGEAEARGERAAKDVVAHWTWRHTARKIIARLDAVGAGMVAH